MEREKTACRRYANSPRIQGNGDYGPLIPFPFSSPSLSCSFSLFRGRFARLVTTMARVKNSITLPPFTFFPSIPSPPSSLVSLSIVIAFRKNFKTDIDLFENFKNLSILDVKIPSFNRVSYLSRDDKRSNFEITAIKLLI